jgi:hypothetical protein
MVRESMTHQLALETRATERYLLDELDEEMRSAFEVHFFSCRHCAVDIKAAAGFVDNAKVVLAAAPVAAVSGAKPWSWSWPMPWLAPAALAASLTIGYFLPHPSKLREGGGFVTAVAVPAGVRGAGGSGQTIPLAKDSSYFLVRLDVADDVTAPRLLWRVKTAGGRELRFQTVRENQVILPLEASDFPDGRYELVLSADTPAAQTIERYPFSVKPE